MKKKDCGTTAEEEERRKKFNLGGKNVIRLSARSFGHVKEKNAWNLTENVVFVSNLR